MSNAIRSHVRPASLSALKHPRSVADQSGMAARFFGGRAVLEKTGPPSCDRTRLMLFKWYAASACFGDHVVASGQTGSIRSTAAVTLIDLWIEEDSQKGIAPLGDDVVQRLARLVLDFEQMRTDATTSPIR